MAIIGWFSIFVLDVANITAGHVVMGMMAWEAGARSINGVMITISTYTELFGMIFFLAPNLLIVLGETSFGFNKDGGVHFHSPDHFAHTPFFKKQHVFLHSALVVYFCSISTSFWPRWRHCPKTQRARIFLEPACILCASMILASHDHGTGHPDHLPSHPIIAIMCFITVVIQMATNILHLSHPAAPEGREIDLSLKGGDAPVLKMCRLLNSFSHMVVANFLYIDSIMEYMGCRHDVVLIGPPGEGVRQGLNLQTEITTYISGAVMLAGLTITGFIMFERPAGIREVDPKMQPDGMPDEMEPVFNRKV